VKKVKKSEKSKKIDLNFASLCFASKQKLLNRSEAKNLKRKKALFRFKAKITKVKRSEKFKAKRSEKKEVKFYSEIVKHM
jgi:hypothetical protein